MTQLQPVSLLTFLLGKDHSSIMQPNIDHWSKNDNDDILYSIEHRALACHLLESLQENMGLITEVVPIPVWPSPK